MRTLVYFSVLLLCCFGALPSSLQADAEQKLVSFELPLYGSKKTIKIDDHIGKKIIVINFFASWCTACIEEIPLLHKLQGDFKGEALFLAINAGERKKIIKKFLRKYPFNYSILLDPERKVSKKLGVEALPITMVISKEGKIVFKDKRPPKSL